MYLLSFALDQGKGRVAVRACIQRASISTALGETSHPAFLEALEKCMLEHASPLRDRGEAPLPLQPHASA